MNGLHENDRTLDEERPTETTSLLSRHLISTPTVSQGSESEPRPSRSPVGPIIFRLQEQGLPTDYGWCPYTAKAVERSAFILVALMQLRCTLASQTTSAADVWDQWSREQRTTDMLEGATKQILETWSQFLSEAHTSDEVEELLWVDFPLQHNNPVTIRGETCRRNSLVHPDFSLGLSSLSHSNRLIESAYWARRARYPSRGPSKSHQNLEIGANTFD